MTNNPIMMADGIVICIYCRGINSHDPECWMDGDDESLIAHLLSSEGDK